MNRDLKKKWGLSLGVVLVAALLGLWIADDIIGSFQRGNKEAGSGKPFSQYDHPNPPTQSVPPDSRRSRELRPEDFFGAPGERIVIFESDEEYRKFLASLDGSKLRRLGQIDALRAVRVGFSDYDDLDDALGDRKAGGNYQVQIPETPDLPEEFPDVAAQPGAAGFGRSTLEWLGIEVDNSEWGKGVKIAILDTGVGQHSGLKNVTEIDLISLESTEDIPLHGHGTAVASLIVGDDGITPGIAPAAELLSVRIADENGNSNSFLLADGIVRAVDEGASIINISMGSYGDSTVVRNAVEYALEHQVLIVAAAGNEGLNQPAYPAAYEGVLAVGAVDSNSQHLNFSNTGEEIDMGAPGYEIVSAWPDDQFNSFSGTSASSPITAAAIAATMSELNFQHVDDAREVVINNLNAAGAPGDDPQFGDGILDVGRVMESTTPGIYDPAVATNWYVAEADGIGTLEVVIENRGTASLGYANVEVTIGNSTFVKRITNLKPGETGVVTLPVDVPSEESINIRSEVSVPGVEDIRPENNVMAGEVLLVNQPSEEFTSLPPDDGVPRQ